MHLDARMKHTQRTAHDRLMALPNVVGTGLGAKYVGGVRTRVPALAVFVSRKWRRGEMSRDQLVPTSIDGIATDVIEESTPRALQFLGEMESDDVRPLMGGTTITTELGSAGSGGTLGCFVYPVSDPQKILLLTNYHVLYFVTGASMPTVENQSHPYIGQYRASPSCSGCCNDRISNFVVKAVYSSTVDAAVAQIFTVIDGDDEEEKNRTQFRHEVLDYGVITGTASPGASSCTEVEIPVTKRGAATLGRSGIVTHVGCTFDPVIHGYEGVVVKGRKPFEQIRIAPMAGDVFATSGDSGAVVLDGANKVIGLLHGAGASGAGFADDINNVKSALGIDVLTETPGNRGLIKKIQGPLSNGDAASAADLHGRRALDELAARAQGRVIVQSIERHREEVLNLVNHDRRTMVRWQRAGGPLLMRHATRIAYDRSYAIPSAIGERQWNDVVGDVASILIDRGSPELARDVLAYRGDVAKLRGMTFPQIVDLLGAPDSDANDGEETHRAC